MHFLFLIIAALVSLWLEIGVVAVVAEAADVNLCDWQSKTDPESLNGNQGNSSENNYWFQHLSDVDSEKKRKHFVFSIKNKHPKNYLPAEWLRSDKTVQMKFSRIVSGGCGGNDFETFLGFQEDPKGIIQYGPLKQHKKDAPLYIRAEPVKKDVRHYGPWLTSTIIADLQDKGQNKYRLHLEFITESEGGTAFTYIVKNLGSRNEVFRIPTFSNAWEKFGRIANVRIYQDNWEKKDGGFAISRDGNPRRLIMNLANGYPFQEKLVRVEVLSKNGELVTTGHINIYLPVIRK